MGRGFVPAAELVAGTAVSRADGTTGTVDAVSRDGGPAVMWNLTVELDHTFFVGGGAWWVHNLCADELVDLPSADRRAHILDGDATGDGHGPGPNIPGKDPFPSSWTDAETMHYISGVATDPSLPWTRQENGRISIEGSRGGVDIRVILEPRRNYDIWTAHPLP